MLAKIITAVAITAAAGLVGLSAAYDKRQNARRIHAVQQALDVLRTEISSAHTELRQALQQAATADLSGVFAIAADQLYKGAALCEAWEQAVSTVNNDSQLREVLRSFGLGLSSCDVEGQLRNIDATKARLQPLSETADQAAAKASKLYAQVGTLIGLAITIVSVKG